MSAPTSSRLERELTSLIEAAELLAGARRTLFSTGAGMSAEAGVPTYRDEHGQWRDFEAFTRKGIRPVEVAHARSFQESPELAWGFHEYLRRIMARAVLHDGYAVLARWMQDDRAERFLLTTNVDELHRRSGVPEVKLCERYGTKWELQCSKACTPTWWPDHRSPLCELDETTMRASKLPLCPFCGAVARPRVLLDHDELFLAHEAPLSRYEAFLAEPIEVLVVIGTTLWFSWPEGHPRPRVVSINPDPTCHERYENPIALTMGARDALVGIDWALRRIESHRVASRR